MFNKKRLAMMAVAASMVLPTNLTYLSEVTPVLAANPAPTITSTITGTAPTGFTFSTGKLAADLGRELIDLTTGTYTLTDDLIIKQGTGNINHGSITVQKDQEVTIELAGHTITSDAPGVLKVYDGGKLTIKGPGTIICNSTSTDSSAGAAVIWGVSGKAIINVENDVALTSKGNYNIHGIAINDKAPQAEVTVENSSINISEGIGAGVYANGLLVEDAPNQPIIKLNGVTIENELSHGIYQAGSSDITVSNCLIKGSTGIETRSGILKVENSVVKGSEEETTVVANSDGTTTTNVGLAVAQHTTKLPIIVTVENTQISGNTALAVVDPESPSALEKVELTLKDSVLSGNKETGYDLAYTALIKSFTADGITLETTEAPQKVEIKTTDGGKLDLASETTEAETKLYTVTPKPANAPNIPLGLPEDSTFDPETDINADGTLTAEAKDKVKKDLQDLVNTLSKENKIFEAYTNSGDVEEEVALNYDYTVEDVASKSDLLADGTYNFKAQLTAKLNKDRNSLICLVIPYSDASPEEGAETVALNEDAPAATTEDFKLYVTLETVLDKSETSRLKLSADQIDTILKAINKKREEATQDPIKYSSSDLTNFEALDLDRSYPIQQINTPIEITVNDDKYEAPKKGPTGNSSKPKPKPEEPMEPVATPTTMYRLYNRLTGEHLYTIDKNERDNLLTSDTWKDEGEGWIAPSESAYPVYRLLNPNNSDHHYTMDKNEFDTLPSYGWVAEGVAFFSADKDNPENVLLHRLYNPNATGAGSHHYTVDTNERDTLVAQGWTYEGLAWAGLPANK